MKNRFKSGMIVVFDPDSFSSDFWKMSERDRVNYYGDIGYDGTNSKKFFITLCEIKEMPGHWVLVSLDGKSTTIGHEIDLRKATKNEI